MTHLNIPINRQAFSVAGGERIEASCDTCTVALTAPRNEYGRRVIASFIDWHKCGEATP